MREEPNNDIKTLVDQIASGDEKAFRMLFNQCKERFYSSAFKMIHSSDQSEDIVQETFVMIWVKRALIAQAENAEAYLYTILQNVIYAHFRKTVQERQQISKFSVAIENNENTPETWLIEKEKRSILENVISRLPTQQKTIYRLAKQQGLSREEIAQQLNISPNTVRNHLAAAVAYLRAWAKTNESVFSCMVLLLSLFHA